MLEKIGQDKVAEALTEAGNVLRAVTAERDEAISKLAAIELRNEAVKVASSMVSKGLTSEPIEYVTENLMKMAEQGKFAEVKKAVEMVGPDMGQKIANLNHDDRQAQGGSSSLESYLLGG